MFTADAELDVRAGLAAFFDGDLDQLSNTSLVDRGEWVLLDDLEFCVMRQEAARIVAAHAESGLGQVIRSEAEELCS